VNPTGTRTLAAAGDAVRWDEPVRLVTDRALTLAAGSDHAPKAALLLCEVVQLHHLDPLALFAGCRYRLAGVLDHDPADRTALAALGLVALAALEPPPQVQARRELRLHLADRALARHPDDE